MASPTDRAAASAAPPAASLCLDADRAAAYARIALANIGQEYPYQPAHVQAFPGDHADPRVLHPLFAGSYDWHSCVHMHWLLARIRRRHPQLPEARAFAALLDAELTAGAVAAEAAYFARPHAQSFERTYGWAWLLALAAELALTRDEASTRWLRELAPLVDVIVARYRDYLPRAGYPIRHGMHANSAFGLLLARDFAHAVADAGFAAIVHAAALAWFDADAGLPIRFEPSGADFLSPALVEAALMRRVHERNGFVAWLDRALPGLGTASLALVPAEVRDRTDPQIVHLDGLNLSRAWCLRAIARALPGTDGRREAILDAATAHLQAGLRGVDGAAYVGSHWLATFAALALDA